MAYSVKALAERWDCSQRQIYKLIDSGQLRAFRIATSRKGTRISEEEVTRWESGDSPAHTGAETSGSDSPMAGGSLSTATMRALAGGRD